MSQHLTIIQDEATRWGPDPRSAMIAAAKDRKRRLEQGAAYARQELQREYVERAAKANKLQEIARRAALEARTEREAVTPRKPFAVTEIYAVDIIRIICAEYNISSKNIFQKTKIPEICEVRNICIYEIRRLARWSYPKTAQFMHKDQSTIRHSFMTTVDALKSNPDFNKRIDKIEDMLSRI